jgi:hypothetical protein
MQNHLIAVVVFVLTIVTPLILLYRRGPWPLHTGYACASVIVVLWYTLGAPLRNLSDAAGTYLAGGRVASCAVIPGFWPGDFGRLWMIPDGITSEWQLLINTGFPLVLDIACLLAAVILLRQTRVTGAFAAGFLLMLLVLRPAFDLVWETLTLLSGGRGDIFYLATLLGDVSTLSVALAAIGGSVIVTTTILRRYHTP